jgi:hypothetical protein
MGGDKKLHINFCKFKRRQCPISLFWSINEYEKPEVINFDQGSRLVWMAEAGLLIEKHLMTCMNMQHRI